MFYKSTSLFTEAEPMEEGWGEKYFWKWITEDNHTKTFGNKWDKFLTESEYRSITDIFNLDVFRRQFA